MVVNFCKEKKWVMSCEEMLGRITRRKGGESSNSSTLSGPDTGVANKPLSKVTQKVPHEKNQFTGVRTRLRSQTSIIDLENHDIYLPADFLSAEGTNNEI